MEQILYIGISQSFFAGLLIATRKPRIMANQVLAAWFFLICIEMVIVLINSNLVEPYSIKVLPFTYGPLMYLYAKMMTTEHPKFNYRYLWHFAPFVVFFIVSMIFLDKPVMEGSKGFLVVDRFISLRIIYGASFFISITAYSIATFIVIHRHQQNLKRLVSYSSAKFTLHWLIGLSVTFYISYVLVFIFGLIDILINFMPFDPYELSFIGLTIFAFLYGFFGFNQPSIFEEIVSHKGMVSSEPVEENNKYVRSGLKKKNVEQIRQQVLVYMEESKPYLDRELTINDVAVDLRIQRHFITEVINQHMGKNFYYLINEYRVEEVKRRLKDPKYKNYTILAIAYDAGFNSKSAFNTIFKDLTGMTPSQYLNSVTK
ncbi:MAG: helix-turn-helix domain-containing protein [Bacteroidales bacterium]|nr:helix-turn-helix domain-containing protein [Bacteroidales bacterium]MDT8432900.1 helix-turn-helix domain-containing protein [Bacteroidales bacterium]